MSLCTDEERADLEARATAGERSKAREQGGIAYCERADRCMNPNPTDPLRGSWDRGWQEAKDTADRRAGEPEPADIPF